MIPALVGIPIKPFGIAKARLAPVLAPQERSRLGKAIAVHTARAVAESGAQPVIVTGDPGVTAWATARGWPTLAEPAGGGLDAAAQTVTNAAGERRWAVLHADLPTVTAAELRAAWQCATSLLAPSRDGGTSLIIGSGPFPFRYGRCSFHRHFAVRPTAAVLARPGLALDLDTPEDLQLALRRPEGAWLRDLVGS